MGHSHGRWCMPSHGASRNSLQRLAPLSWQRDFWRLLLLSYVAVLIVLLVEEQRLVVVIRVKVTTSGRSAHWRHRGLLEIELYKIVVRFTLIDDKSVLVVVEKAQEHFDVAQ